MAGPQNPILDYLCKLDEKMDALNQGLQELAVELRSVNQMCMAHAIRRAAASTDEAKRGDHE